MKTAAENNAKCTECGKSRQAHYDMKYCYAASRTIKGTAYVFPIEAYQFTQEEKFPECTWCWKRHEPTIGYCPNVSTE